MIVYLTTHKNSTGNSYWIKRRPTMSPEVYQFTPWSFNVINLIWLTAKQTDRQTKCWCLFNSCFDHNLLYLLKTNEDYARTFFQSHFRSISALSCNMSRDYLRVFNHIMKCSTICPDKPKILYNLNNREKISE